jgi:hypothetical protein
LDDSNTGVINYVKNIEGEKDYSKSVKEVTIILNKNVTSVLPINELLGGRPVTIQRGSTTSTDYYLFRGEVVSFIQVPIGWELTCKNKYYSAQRREITYSYDKNIDPQNGIGSEIFKDIIDRYTSMQYSPTSIVSTGNELTLDKFSCNHNTSYERLNKLASTYNMQHYYNDRDDFVYFEPIGLVDTGVILTVGKEIIKKPDPKYFENNVENFYRSLDGIAKGEILEQALKFAEKLEAHNLYAFLNLLEKGLFNSLLSSSIGLKKLEELKDLGEVTCKRNGGINVEIDIIMKKHVEVLKGGMCVNIVVKLLKGKEELQ